MADLGNQNKKLKEEIADEVDAVSLGALKIGESFTEFVGNENHESKSSVNDEVIEEVFTSSALASERKKQLDDAIAAKEEGNTFFREKKFEEAVSSYSRAIDLCPQDDAENMAVFFGNRAASYIALREYDLAVEDCTKALDFKSDYTKVLMRRSNALEYLEKFEEALEDVKRLRELDALYPKINEIISKLQRKSEERLSKMKDEALGKLKDLGNTILGNFGMSLDNFKMTQDPNTGSWSVSMNNGSS